MLTSLSKKNISQVKVKPQLLTKLIGTLCPHPSTIRACLRWWPLKKFKNINLYRPAFWGLLGECRLACKPQTYFRSSLLSLRFFSAGKTRAQKTGCPRRLKTAPVRCGSVEDCILNVLYLSWRQQPQSGQPVWASEGNITRLQKRQFGPCVGSCKPKLAENKLAMVYHQTSTQETKSSSMFALSKL